MKYAVVFPGQGAQEVGMGKDFFDRYTTSRAIFERSNEALGFNLSRIIFSGPDIELEKTEYAQPAILTTSMALFRCLEEEKGIAFTPEFVAGHSLGEYTALVASEALSLEDGVRLVHLRGKLMQEAVPLGVGSMAAIIGLDRESVISICESASELGICQAANFNAPGQIVISGERQAVDKAISMCKDAGAKRALPLKVSAPFHSRLMRPVADRLRESIARSEWKKPKWPLVANVSAQKETDVESIQEALFLQTFMPVLWSGSVEFIISRGVRHFVEIGPGSVLTGLIKRISADANCLSLFDLDGLGQVIDFLKGGQYDDS